MKTILVPIDYSDNSKNALSHALHIARLAKADIILLHAFYPIVSPPAAYDVADVVKALEERRTEELATFAEATFLELTGSARALEDISITAVARMGGSYEKILEAIEKYEADLVVMGMQGGEAISQAVLGSTTISVMQQSQVPVLAVPKNVPFKPLKAVVFATNLRQLPASADLHQLRDFVLTTDAKLQVLHLYRNQEQQAKFDTQPALDVLADNLQDVDYTVSFGVQENVAAGIQQFIQQQQADLLVLIPQKHTFLERLLDRSITGKITAHPIVPLLALPSSILQPAILVREEVIEA